MDLQTPEAEQITVWLAQWRDGKGEASEQLFEVVYPSQLRRIAARFLSNERDGHTLEPNALVPELYLRLLILADGASEHLMTFGVNPGCGAAMAWF